MKIEFFKKSNIFKKKDKDISPKLYWKFSILGVAICILLAFLFSYNLFNKINKDAPLSGDQTPGTSETINKNRIQNDLQYFTDRENKSKEILNSPAPVVDPSL